MIESKTTITPEVINTIVRYTTLMVDGVSRFAIQPSTVNRIFSNSNAEGMKVIVENNTVYIDLYLILNTNVNVRDVSRKIQNAVSRAVTEMVGMDVGRINIHVEDFETNASSPTK